MQSFMDFQMMQRIAQVEEHERAEREQYGNQHNPEPAFRQSASRLVQSIARAAALLVRRLAAPSLAKVTYYADSALTASHTAESECRA